MICKKWVAFSILLGISVLMTWLLTYVVTLLRPDGLSSVGLSSPVQNQRGERFVFCPKYKPLNSSEPSYHYPVGMLPPNDYSTLIDLKDFKILHNPECGLRRSLLIAVIHSAPAHVYKRQVIRSTWGTRMKTVFMVGQSSSTQLSSKLNEEIAKYGDIVQGSFLDSYRNMTYKHVMSLKWVCYRCKNSTYILKADDDAFVHVGNLYKFLQRKLSRHGVKRLILCQAHFNEPVKRGHRSRYRALRDEYPANYFPEFCAGAAIVYSPDVVFELYTRAQQTKYFWIDDVHVTGTIASSAGIPISDIGDMFQWEDACQLMIQKREFPGGLLFCVTRHPNNTRDLWILHGLTQPSYLIRGINS